MRLRVIAVGTRMPQWVDDAFEDYARRLRRPWGLTLTQIAPAYRSQAPKACASSKKPRLHNASTDSEASRTQVNR